MKEARLKTALVRNETISQARMAELVSDELGRSIQQTQWGRYEAEENEPPLDVIQATGKVSELAPEYIAFGVKPMTDIGVDQVRALTPEELDRADIAAAEDDRRQAAARPRRAAGGERKRGGGRGRP